MAFVMAAIGQAELIAFFDLFEGLSQSPVDG